MSCKKCKCGNDTTTEEMYKDFKIGEYEKTKFNYKPITGDTEIPISPLTEPTDALFKLDYEEDNYDPEQWKIEITKVENGYIVRNKSDNTVIVFEDEDGDIEGLSNMLHYVGSEFGSRYRLEINALESKHDYLKEDFKVMLEDVYQSYNDDSHDVEADTLEQLEEMFGKFKRRDNGKTD